MSYLTLNKRGRRGRRGLNGLGGPIFDRQQALRRQASQADSLAREQSEPYASQWRNKAFALRAEADALIPAVQREQVEERGGSIKAPASAPAAAPPQAGSDEPPPPSPSAPSGPPVPAYKPGSIMQTVAATRRESVLGPVPSPVRYQPPAVVGPGGSSVLSSPFVVAGGVALAGLALVILLRRRD